MASTRGQCARDPAARSRNSSHTCPAAISRPLPLRSTTSEPEPAAKSPIVAAPPPSPTAISCLGAFRPPAIGARGKTFPPGGRKPAHKRSLALGASTGIRRGGRPYSITPWWLVRGCPTRWAGRTPPYSITLWWSVRGCPTRVVGRTPTMFHNTLVVDQVSESQENQAKQQTTRQSAWVSDEVSWSDTNHVP